MPISTLPHYFTIFENVVLNRVGDSVYFIPKWIIKILPFYRKLFHKVDAQEKADGFVTEEELKKWIQYTQNRYIREDSDKQMKQNDADKDGFVTWDEYKKATYGFLDDNESEKEHYTEMLARDEQRFKLADKESDMKLSLDEFSAFLHPENHDHMKGIVVNETLTDIDKDKDGHISLEEYLGLYSIFI